MIEVQQMNHIYFWKGTFKQQIEALPSKQKPIFKYD